MAITSIPTRDVGSLGPTKSNAVEYTNTATQLAAEEYNATADGLIEAMTDIGTDTTPAAGSIKARLDTLEAAPSAQSQVLWNWNEKDIVQFTATNQLSSVTGASIAKSTYLGVPTVELTAASLDGICAFPITSPGLTLAENYDYTFEFDIYNDTITSSGSHYPLILPAWNGSADGGLAAVAFGFTEGSSSSNAFQLEGASAVNGIATPLAGQSNAAPSLGLHVKLDIRNYSTPWTTTPAFVYRVETIADNGVHDGFVFTNDMFSSWAAVWQNTYSPLGICIGYRTAASLSGSVHFANMRVLRHPKHRT